MPGWAALCLGTRALFTIAPVCITRAILNVNTTILVGVNHLATLKKA